MFARVVRSRRRLTGRDLQRLFAITMLLPGLLLTAVGIRAWRLDAELADQRLRERVSRAAEVADVAVADELRSWQRVLTAAQSQWPPALPALPAMAREALTQPGVAVLLRRGASDPVWPPAQVAYRIPGVRRDGEGPVSAPQAVDTAPNRHHAASRALNLRARALRAAGHLEAARQAYERLAQSEGALGGVPASLVGRHALIQLTIDDGAARPVLPLRAFYRDLSHGYWPLEATRYRFYSEWALGLLAEGPQERELTAWRAMERRTLHLADVARTWLEMPDRTEDAQLLQFHDPAIVDVALFVRADWLRDTVWPQRLAAVREQGFDIVVRGADGRAWFDRGLAADEAVVTRTGRATDVAGLTWEVSASPRDRGAVIGDVTRSRRLTLIMVVLVLGLLAFGTFLTSHVVRRELEVARLQADFVSAVSHEFRSPLTGIRQLGEMLCRGRVPDEARRHEYYTKITEESTRLGRLVENLLQAARIDGGRQHLQTTRIDTADWLHATIAEARTQPALRHATIEADIPTVLPSVVGDREALSSALHNLIDNAVKYSPDGAPVRCDAHAADGHVLIRVADRGVGMSEDDRRHAFERFRRGRDPITARVKGTGLGLSLVKDIVQAHGGEIRCDSRPGEGTTFSIRLDAREDA